MTEAKPKTHPVGTVIDVPDGATVVRPGSVEPTVVSGKFYALDVAGTFVIDGTEVVAK